VDEADGTISYRDAGVDLDAAQRHTSAIAGLIAGGQTGFAALTPLPPMRDPLLVTCTDGIGTKLLLAQELGRLEGLGQDLVAMCVNDLICTGARPLTFLDYLVERDEVLGPRRVRAGDVVMGIPSSGLHSNGYSLVRALVSAGAIPADADLLLAPTRLYTGEMAALRAAGVPVRSAAHITGGGLIENLPRALPEGLTAVIDPRRWEPGPAMSLVLDSGRVEPEEAWRTFNMGLGMCLILPDRAAPEVVRIVPDARVVGLVEPGAEGFRRV
jgi:phosphoribosylformylglycinamidine cyclo-ligase